MEPKNDVSKSVITRLRRALGMTALARRTKSRGNETLTTSYCRREAGIDNPHNWYGRWLLTVIDGIAAVKPQADSREIGR
jgi:hypothetical protein